MDGQYGTQAHFKQQLPNGGWGIGMPTSAGLSFSTQLRLEEAPNFGR